MVLRFLVEKEFKQIVRNPVMLGLILFFPLLVLLLLPWAVSFEVKEVRLCVVNESGGSLSRRLVGKLEGAPSIGRIYFADSYGAAFELVQENRVDAIVQFPRNFDRDLQLHARPQLLVATSAVDGTTAILSNEYLMATVRDFVAELRGEDPGFRFALPFEVVSNFRYNPTFDFKVYMLPAFIVILITLLCGILPALNIVQEKESGTIQQLNVTPVRKSELILSKMIPYWIIGVITVSLSMLILGLLYGLWPRGSVWVIYLVSLLFVLAITGIGIVVSNYSSTLQQAMLLVLFFILIFILMSGLFTGVDGMPIWGQVIAYMNPLTYYIDSIRLLYLKGAYASDLRFNFLVLSGFVVVMNGWAVLSYKKIS